MICFVLVKPGSKKGPFVKVDGENDIVVYLREKPIDGAANTALVKILAKHFSVPKTSIVIKSGHRGRKKLIEILETS